MLTVEEIRELHNREFEERKEAKKEDIRLELKEAVLGWLIASKDNIPFKNYYQCYEIDLIKEMEGELIEAGYSVSYKKIVWHDHNFQERTKEVAIVGWL